MKFKKYPSIENTYRKEFIEKIMVEEKHCGVWVVTEKIHGANFSFWCGKKETRMAKRTCLLANDSQFFGIQNIKEELIVGVKKLYTDIYKRYSKPGYIGVFGELFGGAYPHSDVEVDIHAKKVQRGVYYCPHNAFMIYDIQIEENFMPFIDMQYVCLRAGLHFIHALHVGKFHECVEHSNEFPSTIYKYFPGLPEIENNICEGIVIRPANQDRYLSNGKRIILKSKNDKFSEKDRKPKIRLSDIVLSPEGEVALKAMSEMVTENRYDAVASKEGEVKPSDFGMLQGQMMRDIIGELMKDTKVFFDYNNLEQSERKKIQKTIGSGIAKIIRKRLLGM